MRNTLNIRRTFPKKTHLPKLHLTQHKSLNMFLLGYEYRFDTPINSKNTTFTKTNTPAKTNSFTIR
jgi:hypothetical protein